MEKRTYRVEARVVVEVETTGGQEEARNLAERLCSSLLASEAEGGAAMVVDAELTDAWEDVTEEGVLVGDRVRVLRPAHAAGMEGEVVHTGHSLDGDPVCTVRFPDSATPDLRCSAIPGVNLEVLG